MRVHFFQDQTTCQSDICYYQGKFLQLFFTASYSFLNTLNLCSTMFKLLLGILDYNFLQLFSFFMQLFTAIFVKYGAKCLCGLRNMP